MLLWSECYFRSKPVNENGVPTREYRQRMFCAGQEIELFVCFCGTDDL